LLKRGQNVGLLVDQDARKTGVFVDFFGRPASTTPTPARLAIYTGAPIAFVYARQVGRASRFRIVLADLIEPQQQGDPDAEVRRITQRLTSDLEREIRNAPEEWLWLHHRWKTYPGKYRPV
jgi:KDO2-lipid IV(A) lauroyltransferase